MKENAIKWKKIVVDVQNIVFYRRSIDFVKTLYRRSMVLYVEDQWYYIEMINSIIWKLYGDDQ